MGDDPIPLSNKAGWVGERRRQPRRRVLLQGKLVFPHTGLSADCSIRDLSEGGARIAVDRRAIPADPFLFVVREAVPHETTPHWLEPRQTGLSFNRSHALDGEVSPPLGPTGEFGWSCIPR